MATTTLTDIETPMELGNNSKVKKRQRLTYTTTSRPTTMINNSSGSEKNKETKKSGGGGTREKDFGYEKYGGLKGIVLALPAIRTMDGQKVKTTATTTTATTSTRNVTVSVCFDKQMLFKKEVCLEKNSSDVVSDRMSIRKKSCSGNGSGSKSTVKSTVSSPRRAVGDGHCNIPEESDQGNNDANGKRKRKSELVSDVGLQKQSCHGNGSSVDHNVKSVFSSTQRTGVRQCDREDRERSDVNVQERRKSDIGSDVGMRSRSCYRNRSGADDNVKSDSRYRHVGDHLCNREDPQGNEANGSKSDIVSDVSSMRKQSSYRNGSVSTNVKSVSSPRHGGDGRCNPEDRQGNDVLRQQRSKSDLVSDMRMRKQDCYRNGSGATNVKSVSFSGYGDRQCNPNPQRDDIYGHQRSKSEHVSDITSMRKQSSSRTEGDTNAKSKSSQRHVVDRQCNLDFQGNDINRQQKRKSESSDLVPDLGMSEISWYRNEPCAIKAKTVSAPDWSIRKRSCYNNGPNASIAKSVSSLAHAGEQQRNSDIPPGFSPLASHFGTTVVDDLVPDLGMSERSWYRNEPCAIKNKTVSAPDWSIRKRSCYNNGPNASNAKSVSALAHSGEQQRYSDPPPGFPPLASHFETTVVDDHLDVQRRRKPDFGLTRDATAARDRHIQRCYLSETSVTSFACGSKEVCANTADDKQMTNNKSVHVEMLNKRYGDTIRKAEQQLASQGNVKYARFTFEAKWKVRRETEREAARRTIREMKKTVDFDGNQEAMRELAKMIGSDQVYLGRTHYPLYDFNSFFRPCC